MSAYSPFESELKDLTPESLDALRQTSEGWYVEYKREVPNASSIAKSISAFANTYGGWLFYGVAERSKEDAVAGEFVGIDRAEVDGNLQRIRQAIAGQVNPSPHFDTKLLWGPCEAIGLKPDHAIICIHVPWSAAAPHVHKSGQIYRRVADGSEPKPEADRFVLDQLFRRSDDIRDQCRDWVERDPEFSKGEEKQPFLRLMLVADIWGDRNAWIDADLSEMREMFSQNTGVIGAVPFDSLHTTSRGFQARQLMGNDPFNLGLTWQIRRTLTSDVFIPLRSLSGAEAAFLSSEEGYENGRRFRKMMHAQKFSSVPIVDLNYLFNLLIGIVEINRRILTRAGWNNGFFAKARLLNVWRTIPFVDVPLGLDDFEAHGIPLCLNRAVTSPPGTDPDTFSEIGQFDHIENEGARVLLQAIALFTPVAQAYGLPAWIDSDPDDDTTPWYYDELQNAGRRSMEAQRIWNEQKK